MKRDPLASIEDRELRIAALAVRLYAETHPRPSQVSQSQAGNRFIPQIDAFCLAKI